MSTCSIRCLAVVFFVAAVALVPVDAASAQQYYVSSEGGNDANSCTSPDAPCLTIQAAVHKALDGSQIHVAAGTYPECIQINGRDSLAISGSDGAEKVLLVPPDGASCNTSHVVTLWNSHTIQVRNVVIQGNRGGPWGGVAVNESRALWLA